MNEYPRRGENSCAYRRRQQAAIRALCEVVRRGGDPARLIEQTPAVMVEAFGGDGKFCQILEYSDDKRSLVWRAGAGWTKCDGATKLEAGVGSFGGFVLISSRPSIFETLSEEQRFRPSPMLVEHRVVSGAGVVIGTGTRNSGALCVFSDRPYSFDQDDLAFLECVAAVIAHAIESGKVRSAEGTGEGERLLSALARCYATVKASRFAAVLTANISHEIRTPLNIILGYSELIEEQIPTLGGQDLASYVEAMQRAGRRLLHTVEEILDFSKVETGTLELNPVEIALGPLLEGVVSDFSVRAAAKGLNLTCQIDSPTVNVRFDRHCLERALANLIDNAVKFTEQGSIAVRLFREKPDRVMIEIRDTGIGIDQSYVPHLFEPFSQEDCSYARRFEGTGLGLALARKYLELNGATIRVASTRRQGTIFTIDFPPEAHRVSGLGSRSPAETPFPPAPFDVQWAPYQLSIAFSSPPLDRRL